MRMKLLFAFSFAAVSSFAASVTVELPTDWRSGERVERVRGYARISAPKLLAPDAPVAAPDLPCWIGSVAIPEGASNVTVSAEAEWSEPEALGAPVMPTVEPVPYPQTPEIPAPDAEAYSVAYPASPAALGDRVFIEGAWRQNVRITPYRVSEGGTILERAVSVAVTVSWEGGETAAKRSVRRLQSSSSGAAEAMVIVSPPAFLGLWADYIAYRNSTHPDLNIFVKSTADIYRDYPVVENDYALSIHKYLEHAYANENVKIVLLGAGPQGNRSGAKFTNMQSLNASLIPLDPETQIPARYPAVFVGQMCQPSDLYYACLDRLGGREVWDSDGDHVYMGSTNSYGGSIVGESDRSTIDFAPELQVMRLPLQPLIVETDGKGRTCEYTAAMQMSNWVRKIKLVEGAGDRVWTGEGNNAILGANYFMEADDAQSLEEELRDEREFFDGGINHFSPRHSMRVVDNEWEVRTRNHQFFSGMRANNLTRIHVGYHWSLPDPYGGDWTGNDALTNTAATLPVVYSEDFDAAIVQSHGWARGADPIYAPTLMMQDITGVTPILYCPLPCESGWMDYTVSGQNVTNATCVGAAACLAPGGFAASYNNTRVGYWNGFGDTYSSLLEGYLLEATYAGKCGHDFVFDPDGNLSALNPVSAGKALLMARQKLGASGGTALFGKFIGWCIVGLNGFGDPLVTVTPQIDAANEFSRVVYRVLTLTENPTVATTNSAARLVIGGGVNRLATNGEGILRATVDAKIAASEIAWEVAGGVGRKVVFDSSGGRLVLPGSERRYFGRTFANVDEIAVTGENVTLDFGFNRENNTLPLGALSFNSTTGGTNVFRNARMDVSTDFTGITIPVSNSTLRCELTSAVRFALTDAELNIATNPMWKAVAWDKPIALNNSRVVAGVPDFGLKNLTLTATGGSNSLTSEAASSISVEGDLTINLSNGATLTLDSALANTTGANSRLLVSGNGTLALAGLPLVGFTTLSVGAGVTLALPATEAESIRILTGGASANVTFANNATVLVGGEALTTDYGFMGGTFFRDTSAMCVPPYSRTLDGADESWFNSSDWFDGNGLPFGSSWANAALVAGSAVNLSVGSSASEVETVNLSVEDDVEMSTLSIDGSAVASALAITPANGARVAANNINISSLFSPLTLGFDVDSQAHPISFTPKGDLTIAGRGGYGTLTINSGRTVTLNRGWFGTISNSGTLVCSGTNAADWAGISLPWSGQGVTVSAPITVAGEYKTPTAFNVVGANASFDSASFTVNPNCDFNMTDGARMTVNGSVWVNGAGSTSRLVISGGSVMTITERIVANNSNPMPGNSSNNSVWDISGAGTKVIASKIDNGWFCGSSYPTRVSLSDGGALILGSGGVTGGDFTTPRYVITSSEGIVGADGDWSVAGTDTMSITIPYGKTHVFDPMGHTITYPCKITGTGTLVVTNSASAEGALVLSGANNDWSGGTRLLGGTTRLAAASALPAAGTVYIGEDAVLDLGTVRPAHVTFDAASSGRIVFTLTDDEASWGMLGIGTTLGKFSGDTVPASFDYFCTGAGGGVYEGYFTVQNGFLTFYKTTNVTLPISAVVSGEQDWTALVWKDAKDTTQNLAPNRLAAFGELYVSAEENDAKLVLNTETLPPTVVLEGTNRLEIDIGELAEDALPNLIVSEGATAEFFESAPFPAEKLSNRGAVRFMSETNIEFTVDSFIAGTNRWQRGYFVGIEDEPGLDSLLVAEDDEVSMLEDAKSENRHAMGFTVTGGNLSFQNAAGSVWLGHLGASSAFTQTGGTVEFDVHESSAADRNWNSRGVLFGWTGAGNNKTYAVNVLGGVFSAPNAHINYWEAGTTLTVGNGESGIGSGESGIVRVKGIVANKDMTTNKVRVNSGGILELGETGITALNLDIAVAGGTIRAASSATIAPALAFNGGTLAAKHGATLTVAGGFLSATGELTIGAEGWDGTVCIGESRPTGVTLSAASGGILQIDLTAAETAAGEADIIACSAMPEVLTVFGYDPDGNKWKGTSSVVGGFLRFTPAEIVPDVLEIPEGTRLDLSTVGATRPTIVTGGGEALSVGVLPSANYNFTNDLWTGTVVISNFSLNNWDPAAWSAYGNRIQMTAFSGYPKNANVTNLCELVLVDSESGSPAFSMGDGYSDASCVFGALSGTGTFRQTKNVLQGFSFLDASEFFGVFDLTGCNVTLGNKIRHRYVNQGNAGSVFLDPDGSLGMKMGTVWSAKGGITLNGPINLVADESELVRGAVVLTNSTGAVTLGNDLSLTVNGASRRLYYLEKSGNSAVILGVKPHFTITVR